MVASLGGLTQRSEADNRGLITISIMLATLMNSLDTDDRQRRFAAHPRQRLRVTGPNHLGFDLLHRGRRDHDPADRLARRTALGASWCF